MDRLMSIIMRPLACMILKVYAGHRGIPSHVASKLAEFTPRTQLTPRELEILQFLAKGLSNRDIAAIVGREESTVKVHVKNIMAKLDVDDRTKAVVVAIQRGFLHIE